MNQRIVVAVAVFAVCLGTASAQQASWKVKPEWVKAHEEFLASDAMRGRGSATHDEEVAATYVASEFEGYGLKFAPGMGGYLQRAEVVEPHLDGKATIVAGGVTLREGADFDLLYSSTKQARGPLMTVRFEDLAHASVAKGAMVLVTGVPSDANAALGVLRPLRRAGVAAILLSGTGLDALYGMSGGRTRTGIHLVDAPPERSQANVAVLRHADALKAVAAESAVSLDVKVAPGGEPRYTYNAVGYLQGTDLNAGTILLTAHLDHLGISSPVKGDAIYNGANDDAAGTTAVMELAHALAAGPRLKRSVLFVCYGSEEAGELGSEYFGAHPPVPLKDLVTNLEFEMIGNQDPKMPRGVLLLTGWDRSNLGPTLASHGALLGADPYPEQHFFERSDNYQLALKGVVAHTAAGWGTVPTYHQPNDDLAHLDLSFMTAAIQSLVEPMRWLADSDFKPQWKAGGQPTR